MAIPRAVRFFNAAADRLNLSARVRAPALGNAPELGDPAALGSSLSRGQKIAAAAAGIAVAGTTAVLGGHALVSQSHSLTPFKDSVAAGQSFECTTAPEGEVSGTLANGRAWKATLRLGADELGQSDRLSKPTEAALCDLQAQAGAQGRDAVSALAQGKLSDTQQRQLTSELKAAAVASSATRLELSADDAKTVSPAALASSFDAAAAKTTSETGAALLSSWNTLGAQERGVSALAGSRAHVYSETDAQVLKQGLDAGDLTRVPGAEPAGGKSYLDALQPLSKEAASTQQEALNGVAKQMKTTLGGMETRLVKEVESDYLLDHATPPTDVEAGIRTSLEKGKPLGPLQAEVQKQYLSNPAAYAAHLKVATERVQAVVKDMVPGMTLDAPMTSMVEAMVKSGATVADINNAVVEKVAETPAFRVQQLEISDEVWNENAAGTDCSVDAIVNALATLRVSDRTEATYQAAASQEGFNTRSGIPGGPFLGEQTIALAKARGVKLEGSFDGSPEIAPMREALKQGYVLVINGNVQGSNAGHFLVVQKLNADGTYKMNDSVTSEFSSRSISEAQLYNFTHNGQNPPGFYALRLSHADTMKGAQKFLMQNPPAVS